MTRRVGGLLVLVPAVVAAIVVALSAGSSSYRLRFVATDVQGLRAGADVRVGGVRVGRVARVRLGRGDRPVVDLDIDHGQAPVRLDASVAIASRNLLGQKYVELDKGSGAPAASGYTLAVRRVSTAVDLDQVLDVLDADTRNRLAVLIDSAGAAVAGRRGDLHNLLAEFPRSSIASTRLLAALVSDNHTLADVVTRSDAFLAAVARRRGDLSSMIDRVGDLATAVAARREGMRATLAAAPGALRSADAALADLRTAARALGPAARRVSAAAPPLVGMLSEVEPARRAAVPALDAAIQTAPSLAHLGTGAAPILRRTAPTAAALKTTVRAARPLSDAVDGSIDNILGVLYNWSRAIQNRDGFSHVFDGAATVSADTLQSALRRLEALEPARRHRRTPTSPHPGSRPTVAPSPKPRPSRTPAPLSRLVAPVVKDVLPKILPPSSTPQPVKKLLDFLVGS